MKEKVLKASYGAPDKPLRIGEFEIPCYVLENEKRVITQNGLFKAVGLTSTGAARLMKFADQPALKPFINEAFKVQLGEPIKFKIGGTIANGRD